MGFHKRWINIENIISIYKREGVDGVKSYMKTPDAYIVTDECSEKILDIYRKDNDKELIKEIEICISTEEK